MNAERFDFVVIGSGLAGLAFALKASQHGHVCVLTKAKVRESNTNYAQGGIAAAVGESDSIESHIDDTLVAGAGLCDEKAVRFLVEQGPTAIDWLMSQGADFDLDQSSGLALAREGGHSVNRIVHHADKTGWEIERAVTTAVRECPSITVYEDTFVTRLIMDQGRCVGALAEMSDLGVRAFVGRAVMLATGGCGRIYLHTTNPRVATGDGIALASGIGADIRNMEFMQFHPTTLYHPQLRGFLITEAARGEGGTLRNHLGTRFMHDYDSRLEMAPRDVVARAIDAEMRKLDTWCVYLDLTHLKRETIETQFPTIVSKLETVNIRPHRDWIPIVPAQHYSCGGIHTDLEGRTSIPGLFAAGEVACTGVHGANRLASNSLLEAVVFATSAANTVKNEKADLPKSITANGPKCVAETDAVRLKRDLQHAMTDGVGIVRTNSGLANARSKVSVLLEEYASLPGAPFSQYSLETHNLLVTGLLVIDGAIQRRENVGLHYNVDLVNAAPLHS